MNCHLYFIWIVIHCSYTEAIMFFIFGRLPLKNGFYVFRVFYMSWNYMCTQGNMGEQPVAECFTLYKYIGQKKLPGCFLSLDLLSEYRIRHGDIGPLYVTSSYSTFIFCRGVSSFATDCPCGVCCRGLTTCLLYDGPPFGNLWKSIFKILLGCRFDIMYSIS